MEGSSDRVIDRLPGSIWVAVRGSGEPDEREAALGRERGAQPIADGLPAMLTP